MFLSSEKLTTKIYFLFQYPGWIFTKLFKNYGYSSCNHKCASHLGRASAPPPCTPPPHYYPNLDTNLTLP